MHPVVLLASDHGRFAHARLMVEHPLDVVGEHVQPFGRDDHFLLPAADEELPVLADLPDIARVKPSVFERARRTLVGAEVSGRDVVAANQDLAVRRDLHLDAGDRLADRSALRAERVVERHDRRGFGQAVALDHREAHLAPERFELGLEWRRADDERPEFPAEEPVDVTVMPPAVQRTRKNVSLSGARLRGAVFAAGLRGPRYVLFAALPGFLAPRPAPRRAAT